MLKVKVQVPVINLIIECVAPGAPFLPLAQGRANYQQQHFANYHVNITLLSVYGKKATGDIINNMERKK